MTQRVRFWRIPRGPAMRSVGILFVLTAALAAAHADPRPHLPPLERPIDAVDVPVSYVVVSGSVTVRADGVLVNPNDVTYSFDPEFKFSTGYLARVGDGLYRLRTDRVPAGDGYELTIRAAYNDTIIQDGIVQRLGRTHVGSIRIDIPPGRDYDFGQQLLDLQ